MSRSPKVFFAALYTVYSQVLLFQIKFAVVRPQQRLSHKWEKGFFLCHLQHFKFDYVSKAQNKPDKPSSLNFVCSRLCSSSTQLPQTTSIFGRQEKHTESPSQATSFF